MNCIFVSSDQVAFLQNFLLDFIWYGRNKVKLSIFSLPYSLGGMKMINVRHFVHKLRAKWMLRIAKVAKDKEVWVTLAWKGITGEIPGVVVPGMRWAPSISENLDPFYQLVITSFASMFLIVLHFCQVPYVCLL